VRKVIIDRRNRVFDDFFKIEEAYLRYERFDGTMSPVVRRLNFERGDSVAALLFNSKTKHIVLVNQFKYPTHEKGPGWITETMAGMINEKEDAQSAVRREILEETGYRVRSLEHISTFYLSPGGSSERIILYYAELDDNDKITAGGGLAAENEDITNVELTIEDALEKIENGEIADAKTIIAVYWLQNRLANNKISKELA
jgi:nudix-type nucleoside diphosphatase (YffH/AdpP family)